MKLIPNIAGALLGFLFVFSGANFFFHWVDVGGGVTPPDHPTSLFMGALIPTGYLAFVKVVEIMGGLLVAIPRTRNLGLLALGPVIVNIFCFHVFLNKSATLFSLMHLAISSLSLYLLFIERKAWSGLVRREINLPEHQSELTPHQEADQQHIP